MSTDHFPSTHATWIDAQLTIAEDGERAASTGDLAGMPRAHGARAALRRHVMERYTQALSAYVSASGLRDSGERDELVSGFYVGPMADDAFFARWRGSGMPLRRWLMNAMSFHCRSVRRDVTRERGRMSTDGPIELRAAENASQDAAAAFDRAWALAIVNESYARVQAELVDRGREHDDAILRMHLIDGMPYEDVARAIGLSRTECFNATRRVAAAVRESVKEILREEGVPNSELEQAVAEVLRLVDGE